MEMYQIFRMWMDAHLCFTRTDCWRAGVRAGWVAFLVSLPLVKPVSIGWCYAGCSPLAMSSDTRTTFLLLLVAWNRLTSNSGCLPRLILHPTSALNMNLKTSNQFLKRDLRSKGEKRSRTGQLPPVRGDHQGPEAWGSLKWADWIRRKRE